MIVDAEQVIALATKYGVKSLKVGDVEVEFFPTVKVTEPLDMGVGAPELPKEAQMPSDKEMLFYSVGGDPDAPTEAEKQGP